MVVVVVVVVELKRKIASRHVVWCSCTNKVVLYKVNSNSGLRHAHIELIDALHNVSGHVRQSAGDSFYTILHTLFDIV